MPESLEELLVRAKREKPPGYTDAFAKWLRAQSAPVPAIVSDMSRDMENQFDFQE